MAAAPAPGLPGLQVSLFEHAQRLHTAHPDSALPRDGEPYPDELLHPWQSRPQAPPPYKRAGAEAAAVLDEHLSRPGAEPVELERAFHGVYVPVNWNEHVAAAAWRADEHRVRETGRWLVTHSRDRCAVTIGLALLVAGLAEDDIPLNGYFAGQVATAAHLHEAITSDDADDELIGHAGRLLLVMAGCAGMGMTLATYPPARAVIAAHGRHLARQEPAFSRWAAAALLAGHLTGAADEDHIVRNIGFPAAERQHMVDQYASLLNRADWTAIAEAHLQEGDEYSEWIAYATRRVPLNDFTNLPDESEPAPP